MMLLVLLQLIWAVISCEANREYYLWDRSKELVVRATGLCREACGSKRLLRQTKVEADRILTGKSRGLPAVQLYSQDTFAAKSFYSNLAWEVSQDTFTS